MRRHSAEGALVLAAFFFGITFPLVHDALEDVTPFAYLLLRFSIAVLALAPFAIAVARSKGENRRLLWRVGAIAGVLLFGGYATQTIGLQYTSPSTSAFITGLYVCFTPFIEAAVRRRAPSPWVIVGIVVATGGLFLLTGADLGFGQGEAWTLACAALFATWIVYQGGYAHRLHPVPFATVQMGMVALLCIPPAAAQGVGDLTSLALFAAVFTGIACSSIALSLQLFGQRRIAPSRAALILLSEPVFAALAGYVAGERLGAVEGVGAAVILLGIAITEFGPGRRAAEADDVRAEAQLEAHLP
ncbi:MAG: DMT family transporter [Acidimicrobiia bacterium]|nr:DMT family transporter [Acidimicrobiia bacterium]